MVDREDEVRRVKMFARIHNVDVYLLFAVAYLNHNSMLDRYEVQSKVDRFTATGETPAYVSKYLDSLN